MPRKDIKDYTQMQIRKNTLKRLEKLKVHPNQSYEEVIIKLIENNENGK